MGGVDPRRGCGSVPVPVFSWGGGSGSAGRTAMPLRCTGGGLCASRPSSKVVVGWEGTGRVCVTREVWDEGCRRYVAAVTDVPLKGLWSWAPVVVLVPQQEEIKF